MPIAIAIAINPLLRVASISSQGLLWWSWWLSGASGPLPCDAGRDAADVGGGGGGEEQEGPGVRQGRVQRRVLALAELAPADHGDVGWVTGGGGEGVWSRNMILANEAWAGQDIVGGIEGQEIEPLWRT
jgi:hypothetical protein